jgi:membrane protease YdiL (CAAX protease family)
MNWNSAITVLLIGLLLFSSLIVWSVVTARLNIGLPVLPHRERNPVYLSAAVVVASVLSWILAFRLAANVFSVSEVMTLANVKYASLVNVLMIVLILFCLYIYYGFEPFRDLGLIPGDFVSELSTGVCGFLASILPVLAVVVATSPFRSESMQHSFLRFLRANPSSEVILWMAVAVCLLAPLAEELLFRVILQGSLQTRMEPRAAIAVASVIFAAVHNLPDSIALLPLGGILGYIYYQRNSYLACVVVHALFNLINLEMLLLSLGQGE